MICVLAPVEGATTNNILFCKQTKDESNDVILERALQFADASENIYSIAVPIVMVDNQWENCERIAKNFSKIG